MEEQIVTLLGQDREEGLHQLQAHYGNLVRYLVRGVLRSPEDVEECVSDVYLQVWAKFDQYDPAKGQLSTWLTAVARNTALNYRNRRGTETIPLEPNLADPAPTPEEALLRQERAQRLHGAILALDPKDRQLFYRKYYYLQPTAQIAAECGMSERAVEGRLYRLRQKLRRTLGGDAP